MQVWINQDVGMWEGGVNYGGLVGGAVKHAGPVEGAVSLKGTWVS